MTKKTQAATWANIRNMENLMSTNNNSIKDVTMEGYENSPYRIKQYTDAFEISGNDRVTTAVKLNGPALYIVTKEKTEGSFGLFSYYPLSACVAETLMSEWEPDQDRLPVHKYTGEKYTPRWLKPWACYQTANALGKRIHAEWKRLLEKADPRHVDVQRAIWAACCGSSKLASNNEHIYEDDNLVSDIVNYRAAAMAVVNASALYEQRSYIKVYTDFYQSPEIRRYIETHPECEITINNRNDIPFQLNAPEYDSPEWVDILKNWRGLYSPTGESYRSLDRTLMNLPGGIPFGLTTNLAKVNLPRPITDRLELLTLLAYFGKYYYTPNDNAILFATREKITRAMKRVSDHIITPLSPRRTRDVVRFINFVFDDNRNRETYMNGASIVGLAEYSIDYHRNQLEAERERVVEELGGDLETAKPPIPLPETEGVRFLDTVGAVADEGKMMQHCIAGYAREAAQGRYFLFHVEKDGEAASVQIDRDGVVMQSHGPRNRYNEAAKWGERELSRWGKQLKDIDWSLMPPPPELPAPRLALDDFPF